MSPFAVLVTHSHVNFSGLQLVAHTLEIFVEQLEELAIFTVSKSDGKAVQQWAPTNPELTIRIDH